MITGLRQAAIERGIVIAARDLGKLKTWAQAIAAGLGGFAAAGAWGTNVGLVVAARRGRADLGLRARLRAQRAEAVPAPPDELGVFQLVLAARQERRRQGEGGSRFSRASAARAASMAARSCSVGAGVISRSTALQAKVSGREVDLT